MRKTFETPFLASAVLVAATFVAFRVSPWQLNARSMTRGGAQAQEASDPAYSAEAANRLQEARARAQERQGALSLADDEIAKRLQLRPEVQRKAQEILHDFQRRVEARLGEELQAWKQVKGDRIADTSRFMNPDSAVASEIDAWKRQAEQKVFDTLTPREQQQWINYSRPTGLRKTLAVSAE